MATIPLPALGLQPVQQPDTLQKYGQLLALKNSQQQQALMQQEAPLRMQALQQGVQQGGLQIQQMQRQQASEDAIMGSFAKLDPSDPNYFEKGIRAAQATGRALPEQMQKLMTAQLDFKNKAATLTKTQQEVLASRSDALHSLGTQYLGQSDQDMVQNWPTIRQKVLDLHQGEQNFDPNSIPQQFPGRQWVQANTVISGMSAAGMRAAAAQQEAKYKVVNGTLMDVSGPTPQPAMAGQLNPQQWSDAVDSVVPSKGPNAALNQRTHSLVDFYIKQGNTEGAQKAITQASEQIGTVEKETDPRVQQGKIQVATAEGQARANIEAQVARGSNAALATVPPHLVAPATAAATKAGEEYAQAQSVTQRLQEMMDAAKNGNVVSYQLIPQEGALQIVTSQGVKRINMAEIQNYGGGSLFQNLEGHIGKALTGKSIPNAVLRDMADIQAIQQRGSQAKYENELNTINQTYGAKFQPVTMKSTALNQSGGGGSISVGSVITQNGHQYKVTAVDKNGKPTAADPVQ